MYCNVSMYVCMLVMYVCMYVMYVCMYVSNVCMYVCMYIDTGWWFQTSFIFHNI